MKPATDGKIIDLEITGMHCAGCVGAVERALLKAPGVASASVNLATQRAAITLESGDAPADLSAMIQSVRDAGYDAREIEISDPNGDGRGRRRSAELRGQRNRIVAALAFGIPAMAVEMAGHASGLSNNLAATAQGILAAAVVVVAAGPMFLGAFRALRSRSANMDLLVSLGVLTAMVSGVVGLILREPALILFDAAIMIVIFVAVGKHLEARARGRATAALEALASRLPREALRVVNDQVERVPITAVRVGDVLRLPPHATIPVDGEVVSGSISVDESMLTGESLPISRTVGGRVLGGTTVSDGVADMRAVAVGGDSAAARIARLVEQAQASKPPFQRLADRVAGVFVPTIIFLALLTFAGWYWPANAEFIFALKRMIAVLVVACPCAMGLAIPTAVLVGTTRAAECGVFIRDAEALEATARVKDVVLDKTGTLTLGAPAIESIETFGAIDEPDVLRFAAAVERLSQHPHAQAIVRAADSRGIPRTEATEFQSRPGGGVRATVDGRDVIVGNTAWLADNGVDSRELSKGPLAADESGHAIVWVAVDGTLAAGLRLADQIHPESAAAIHELKRLGLRTHLLSGDREAATRAVAESLAVDDYAAELTPDEKLSRVRELVATGRTLAMVGDGVNDAPALAAATVGIAIGTGADVAREAADICLAGRSPALIPEAVLIARRCLRIMKQNLFWAFFYNAVMLPIAVLTPLPPAAATAAMMFSSLSVVGNSLRLRRITRARGHT